MRILCVVLLLAFASSARAQTKSIDTLLVLALDVSGSVNEVRWDVQRKGYAAALRHPDVRRLILSKKVALSLFQWSAATQQHLVIPWHLIDSETVLMDTARRIEHMPRMFISDYTAIGGALAFGITLLEESGFSAARRIIDISGDGRTNSHWGGENPITFLRRVREFALSRDITINGLAIRNFEFDQLGYDIVAYYREHVMGGHGSFVVEVANGNDLDAFTQALVKKFTLELLASAR